MTNFKRIEIIAAAPTEFRIRVDDRWADRLTPEEALGVVASAIFGSENSRPMFVKTDEEEGRWRRILCGFSKRPDEA